MKEYMEKLISENSEELQRLQDRISYLLVEQEKQNEIIEKVQRYTGRDESIFSPRTLHIIDGESLKKEKDKEALIQQEIEFVRREIVKLFEKQNEYGKVLSEIENKKTENKEVDYKEINSKGIENKQIYNQESYDQEINGQVMSKEKIDCENISISDAIDEGDVSEKIEENAEVLENNADLKNVIKCEKKESKISDEKMEMLMESLTDVSKSVDIALALLNGDKNKCRNELKKIKRTLKMCIEVIK